jgi:starch synthase (maltosyl-transferring)
MTNGKSRVIIENVQPAVDGGLYPAKRTVGERVDVTASIFGDGHDHIQASVLYKKKEATAWKQVEMHPTFNDDWVGTFYAEELGKYIFTIHAWIDHFDTWYDGLKKKVAAKIDVQVELKEGIIFLKELGTKDSSLLSIARKLESSEYPSAVREVMSETFATLVHKHPLKMHETVLTAEFEVVVEHKKALFSTWYEFFPRSSSMLPGKHGTFQDCIRLLPRISAMGFDILYFPPIHPIGKINRKGKNNNVRAEKGEPGSPWAIGSDEGGHKSILPALGTLEEYKKLIAEAKKLGIDIGFDLAFQCAPDHPYVKEHPEWF